MSDCVSARNAPPTAVAAPTTRMTSLRGPRGRDERGRQAHQREDARGLRHDAREEDRDRGGGRGIGVGQPPVEGDHGALHEEAAEEERRGCPDERRGRRERRCRLREGDAACPEEEEAEGRQHEHAGHRGEDEVLPGAFERVLPLPQGHEDERGNGGGLDEHVQGEQVAHHRDAVHPDQGHEEEVGEDEPRPGLVDGGASHEERRDAREPCRADEQGAEVVHREGETHRVVQWFQEIPVQDVEGKEGGRRGLQDEEHQAGDPGAALRPARQDVQDEQQREGNEQQDVGHRAPPKTTTAMVTITAAPASDHNT